MDRRSVAKETRRSVDDHDDKADECDSDEGWGEDYDDYDYGNEKVEEDESIVQHNYYKEDDGKGVPLSGYDDRPRDEWENAESEDNGHETGIKLSDKDEHRLLGAFLLAADGGLEGGGGGGGDEEPQLPTDGPSCLQKFTTIAASLGLKTTREKLREDFEKVVLSNRLVESPPGDPWVGAHDTERHVIGFTYKVFRRYYLDKIQGDLLEKNIRQAWEDIHHGTGRKYFVPGPSSSGTDFDAPTTPEEEAAASSGTVPPSGRTGVGETRGRQQQQHQQHQVDQDSDHGRSRSFVGRAELQKILTRDGQVLTDEEVDEILRECRPDGEGRIVYEGYRRMLIDPSL